MAIQIRLNQLQYIIKLKKAQSMSNNIINEIKKRFDQARRADPDFSEIDLSEIKIQKFTPGINAIIEKYKKLEVLHLVDCGLTSLDNFPSGDFVAIDLSKNSLTDSSNFEILTKFANLSQLIVTQNKVQKLQTVLKLASLEKLIEIDFQGNLVSTLPDYSSTVFQKFKSIQFVDRKDKEGNIQQQQEEADYDDEDDDDQQDYEEDDEEEEFDDEDFEEQQSEKPKKGGSAGRKKK